jgi:hypothetical protein
VCVCVAVAIRGTCVSDILHSQGRAGEVIHCVVTYSWCTLHSVGWSLGGTSSLEGTTTLVVGFPKETTQRGDKTENLDHYIVFTSSWPRASLMVCVCVCVLTQYFHHVIAQGG